MTAMQFKARVKDNRTLELPEEARVLGLHAGDEVTVSVAIESSKQHSEFLPSESGLAIMREIAARHKNRRKTDNASTQRLIREARGGAAYGYDPTE